jgi:hypothetical protein
LSIIFTPANRGEPQTRKVFDFPDGGVAIHSGRIPPFTVMAGRDPAISATRHQIPGSSPGMTG